jgi:hypothetical protein
MQQQVTSTHPPNESAPSGVAMRAASLRNRFVINLCGSTTPVALTPPDHAGLRRFTFFVSRRREEGRERFRLHMGYFDSQEDAERLLDIVREIYPGAWAGLAPGQRLAQAEAESAAAAAAEAAATESAAAPTATINAVAVAVTVPDPVTSQPVAESSAATDDTIDAPVLATPAAVEVTAEVTAAPEPPIEDGTAELPALSLLPDQGRRIAATVDVEAATRSLSNVRAAIASLDDTASSKAPTVSPLPELKPAAAVRRSVAPPAKQSRELTDSAALRVLENRDAASATTVNQPRPPLPAAASSNADAARKDATGKNEKPSFAVQLLWSVQPIDITQIPQLAIFSAYTLYGAEGNRDGRRWYGVRLGFFTDAVSAKQVAHYVRSDFSTVSVVPVTARERERARLAAARPEAAPVAAAAPTPAAAEPAVAKPAASSSFEFIEDKQPAPAARSSRGAPGKRAKARSARQVNGRSKAKPMTLEETLEILGAGELKMEDGRRCSINDGLAQLPDSDGAKGKPSRFGRLLERLSGLGS